MFLMSEKRPTYWTAAQIRKLRKLLELTQERAASKVGVCRRQWAGWEAGTSKPSGSASILLTMLQQKEI